MDVLSFTRFSGPTKVPGDMVRRTIITATLPAGSYWVVAKTSLGLIRDEASYARLAIPSDGELDPDFSSEEFMKATTHVVQRALVLKAQTPVVLQVRARAEWNAISSSVIAIKADRVSATKVTG